jgi:gluconate 5-dehydrogenase
MTMRLFDLGGKIGLITGSSRGLGLVMAKGLAQAGATVVLNGRNEERLLKAVASLQSEGLRASGYAFDVNRKEQVTEQISLIEKKFGQIDILVNNAGIQIRGPLEEFKEENFRQLLDVNLTGVFLVSQAVARGMIRRKTGKIINICSLQSEVGRQTIAPYAASKGGLKMLTKGMAVDWGRYNIQTNGIGPGYFITDITKPLADDADFDRWLKSRTPANRWGDPQEILGALIFLASDASNFINGQIIYVDGGILASL